MARKKFEEGFKESAVAYCKAHPEETIKGCAEHLGIGYSTLRRWISQMEEAEGASAPASKKESIKEEVLEAGAVLSTAIEAVVEEVIETLEDALEDVIEELAPVEEGLVEGAVRELAAHDVPVSSETIPALEKPLASTNETTIIADEKAAVDSSYNKAVATGEKDAGGLCRLNHCRSSLSFQPVLHKGRLVMAFVENKKTVIANGIIEARAYIQGKKAAVANGVKKTVAAVCWAKEKTAKLQKMAKSVLKR